MTIDTFTREDFEASLPTGFRALGLVDGEVTYRLATRGAVEIEVRSSIRADGMSAGSGEDSIRAWLVASATSKPLGSKVSRWTTRLPGWQARLSAVLHTLMDWRERSGDCPTCQAPKGFNPRSP